jgi:type IV pilus assembly protein PilA
MTTTSSIHYNRKKSGFTIVELLVVIVVIAILATITIVSFSSITTKGNDSSAEAAVNAFKKKADLYTKDGPTGAYPIAATDLTSDTTKSYYLSDYTVTYVTTNASRTVSASNGTKTINVRKCSGSLTSQASITATNITGLQIISWDFSDKTYTITTIGTGNCPAA